MSRRAPSLRSVSAFEAAARHGSFVRAAEELHLTQSAISHAVRALEDDLQVRLFIRHGRRVSLTSDGRWLAQHVRTGLDLIRHAIDEVDAARRFGVLVVEAPSPVVTQLLLPQWKLYQAQHPGRELDVRLSGVANGLVGADADLHVGQGGEPPEGWLSRRVGSDVLLALGAPSLDVAAGLRALDLIENQEHPWSAWFEHQGEQAPIRRPTLVVSSAAIAVEACKLGLGACVAPASLAAEELNSGQLVLLSEARVPTTGGYLLAWRPDSPKIKLIESFVEWLCRQPQTSSGLPSKLEPLLLRQDDAA